MDNKKLLYASISLVFLMGNSPAPTYYSGYTYYYSDFSVKSIIKNEDDCYEVSILNNGSYTISSETHYLSFLSKNQEVEKSCGVDKIKDDIYIAQGMEGVMILDNNTNSQTLFEDFTAGYEIKYECDAYYYAGSGANISTGCYLENYEKESDTTKFIFRFYISDSSYKFITTSYTVDEKEYVFSFNTIKDTTTYIYEVSLDGLRTRSEISDIYSIGHYLRSSSDGDIGTSIGNILLALFFIAFYAGIIKIVVSLIVAGVVFLVRHIKSKKKNKEIKKVDKEHKEETIVVEEKPIDNQEEKNANNKEDDLK